MILLNKVRIVQRIWLGCCSKLEAQTCMLQKPPEAISCLATSLEVNFVCYEDSQLSLFRLTVYSLVRLRCG